MYVEIEALTKIIDKNKVLDKVSLKMDKGKIYGIKGKNGSGKIYFIETFICYDSVIIGFVSALPFC